MEFLRPLDCGIERCRRITDSAAIQEQLRQTHKMEAIGRLASGIAHDFNNLLVGILGYSEILTCKLAPSHPLRPKAEEIKRSALLARELTSMLLAFSRNEMLEPKIIDITSMGRDIESLLRRTIGEDIRMVIKIASPGLFVKIDAAQFEQTLLNLAVNAKDAMRPGGTLTIEIKGPELLSLPSTPPSSLRFQPCVTILVEDTGLGIAPEVLPHIFEPYFTTKGIGKGTGLGLAMAYSFVKHSGGLITVTSQQNVGTTFEINLPLAKERPIRERLFSQPSSTGGADERILLVEDNEVVRNLILEILEPMGYQVMVAKDATEALDLAQRCEQEIQLLLTDVVMPGMTGQDLAIELSSLRPNIKVLFVSGYLDNSAILSAAEHLGNKWFYLQKPFLPDQILTHVRSTIDA